MRPLAYMLLLFLFSLLYSCKKYLNEKSDKSLVIPSSLNDLEALLDNPTLRITPIAANASTDEYFMFYTDWLSRSELDKNLYVWEGQLENKSDWNDQYRSVYYTNTVLDNLLNVSKEKDLNRWNSVKGSALFIRAYTFYNLAQIFAKQYSVTTASTDLGIPLRTDANFNNPSVRASVQQTYERIIADVNQALTLLPPSLPVSPLEKIRPSRAACYGFLARVYLQMGNYNAAKASADSCLQLYNSLLDFNSPSVQPTSTTPISKYNQEVIFLTYVDAGVPPTTRAKMDSTLYRAFDANDLRKSVFFRSNGDNTFRFKGSLNGGSVDLFTGIAVGEIYLIRAECFARTADVAASLQDLRTLLQKRWKTSTLSLPNVSTPGEALKLVLNERKKELIFRGVRWADVKRLNLDQSLATTVQRNLNGVQYLLPANDLRYVLLIPNDAISLSSMQQNPR